MKRMNLATYLARLGAALFVAIAVLPPLALAAEGGSGPGTSIGVPQIGAERAAGPSAGNAGSSRGGVSVSQPHAAAACARLRVRSAPQPPRDDAEESPLMAGAGRPGLRAQPPTAEP